MRTAQARAMVALARARQFQRRRLLMLTGGPNGLTHRRDVPHEPGEWLTFRQLSAVELDAAEAAAVAASSRNARAMGAELVTALQAAAADNDGTPVRPVARYDAMTLIEFGLVEWSYPAPITPENVRRLDLTTRDWARDQLIAMHFPEPDPALAEAARGNGSSASIAGLTATGAGSSSSSSGGSPKNSRG